MRIILFILLFSQATFAQTTASVGVSISLPSIAILDMQPKNVTFNLALTPPTEAGNPITAVSSTAVKAINFTSAVTPGSTRRISVQLSGSLPNGISLRLDLANYIGVGQGALGTIATPVYITNSQQTILTNIGGAYTGNGRNNGYLMTYTAEISNYALLRTQTNVVSIIYTLIDN